MKQLLLYSFIVLSLISCNHINQKQTRSTIFEPNKIEIKYDINKRNALVEKYDLLNFDKNKTPVYLSVDEFFDGNRDESSIAPNLNDKPRVIEFYKILKTAENNPQISKVVVKITDITMYENSKLYNSWFYSDIIYFVGELTKEEIAKMVKELQPYEVEYVKDDEISKLDSSFHGKKIVYIWWD